MFIDLSEVVDTDYGTGIHRVVRNLTRSLMRRPSAAGWRFVPVAHRPDGLCLSAEAYARDTLQVPFAGPDGPPAFGPDDVLLMLDSAWLEPERFLRTIEALQAEGGQAGAFVYDLIPLRFPQYCVDFMPAVFERWLRFVVLHADFLVCISRAVADDLHAWIDESGTQTRPGLRIGHVHLGSDIDEGAASGPVSHAMQAAMGALQASALMVGTIEPRKRHDVALDAFERAWQAGSTLPLAIVGKPGWNVQALVERLRTHPQAGRKLHWIESASNADLAHAYRRCAFLLQASDAEGFGLPLVEAARHRKPLLLSDIPVFREIAGSHATYFEAGDAAALAARLMEGPPRPSDPAMAISWKDSADRLLELVGGRTKWDHAR